MSIWGFAKGDLDNIAVPFDSEGNACGRGDRSDYPHLFVSYEDNFDIDNSVCIKKCPKDEADEIECVPNADIPSCDQIKSYESYGFIERICIPKAEVLLVKFNEHIDLDYFSEMIRETQLAWSGYIIAFFLSIVVCLVFYFMLQCCSFVVVWVMVIGTLVGLVVGGVVCYSEYKELKDLN